MLVLGKQTIKEDLVTYSICWQLLREENIYIYI